MLSKLPTEVRKTAKRASEVAPWSWDQAASALETADAFWLESRLRTQLAITCPSNDVIGVPLSFAQPKQPPRRAATTFHFTVAWPVRHAGIMQAASDSSRCAYSPGNVGY